MTGVFQIMYTPNKKRNVELIATKMTVCCRPNYENIKKTILLVTQTYWGETEDFITEADAWMKYSCQCRQVYNHKKEMFTLNTGVKAAEKLV